MKRFILALSVTTVLGNIYSAHAKLMEDIKDEASSKGVSRLPLEKQQIDLQEMRSLKPQTKLTKQLTVPPTQGLSEPKTQQAPIYYSRKQAKKLAKAEWKRAKRMARWARIRAKMIRKGLIVERVVTVHHRPIQNVVVSQDPKVEANQGHTLIINFKPKFVFPLTVLGGNENQPGQHQTSQSRLNFSNKDNKGNNINLNDDFNESNLNKHLFSQDDQELVAGNTMPLASQFHLGEENAQPALNLQDENLIKDARLESLSTFLDELNEKISVFEAQNLSSFPLGSETQKETLKNLIADLSHAKLSLGRLTPQMQDENISENNEFGNHPTRIANLEYQIERQAEKLTLLKSELDDPSSLKGENVNETVFDDYFNTLGKLRSAIHGIHSSLLFNHDLEDLNLKSEGLAKVNSTVKEIQSNMEEFTTFNDRLVNAAGKTLGLVENEILYDSIKKTQEFLTGALERVALQKQSTEPMKQYDKTNISSNTPIPTIAQLPKEETPANVNQSPLSITVDEEKPTSASILKEQENFELKSDTVSGVIQPLATALNNLLLLSNLETLSEQFQNERSLVSLGIKTLKEDLLALGSYLNISPVLGNEKEDGSVGSKLKLLQSLITPYLVLDRKPLIF